ncbi:MAG: GNAT family N-acetyltransferase [Alphaproteobacteria bacterium]
MKPLIKMRPGVVEDAEAISRLVVSFVPEFVVHPQGAGAEEFLRSVSVGSERGYLASDRHRFIVAEQCDNLVGVIALRDASHIQHLFVARGHQGKGVARQLWNLARSEIERVHAPDFYTVNSSPGAVPVYRAFGFLPAGAMAVNHGVYYRPMRLDLK